MSMQVSQPHLDPEACATGLSDTPITDAIRRSSLALQSWQQALLKAWYQGDHLRRANITLGRVSGVLRECTLAGEAARQAFDEVATLLTQGEPSIDRFDILTEIDEALAWSPDAARWSPHSPDVTG